MRLRCVWGAFEPRLSCVSGKGASAVRLRCVQERHLTQGTRVSCVLKDPQCAAPGTRAWNESLPREPHILPFQVRTEAALAIDALVSASPRCAIQLHQERGFDALSECLTQAYNSHNPAPPPCDGSEPVALCREIRSAALTSEPFPLKVRVW